jgi:bacterial/archaeal transporter family protein
VKTLKEKWFWYSIASAFCWAGFSISARFGSNELPANMMQFVSAFGFLAFGIVLFAARRFRLEPSKKGAVLGTIAGVLLGAGGIALYAAYRGGSNTAVVTTATSLYPMFTVVLAVLFLRERITARQSVGMVFAVAAIVILSL